jgi:hypothetical protein
LGFVGAAGAFDDSLEGALLLVGEAGAASNWRRRSSSGARKNEKPDQPTIENPPLNAGREVVPRPSG